MQLYIHICQSDTKFNIIDTFCSFNDCLLSASVIHTWTMVAPTLVYTIPYHSVLRSIPFHTVLYLTQTNIYCYDILSIACYELRDPWYGGTRIQSSTYQCIAKPGTTDGHMAQLENHHKISSRFQSTTFDALIRRFCVWARIHIIFANFLIRKCY